MLRQGCCFVAGCLLLALTTGAQPNQPGTRKADGKPEWVKEPIKGRHLHYRKFHSQTIKAEVSYLIYLPPAYEKDKDRRFPVMYWLHGIGGAQMGVPRIVERINAAVEAGKTPAMLVVFVNGVRNSFYCDSADGKMPVETVIVKDLIPHIDRTYRTIGKREGRLIEGFSMGGFGAAHLGFKYPDLFGSVSLIDAALLNADTMQSRHAEFYKRIFGGKKETFAAEDPRTLVEKNVKAVRGRTTVRLAVGALQPGNKSYHQLLTRLKIAHEYTAFPEAGHNHGAIYDQLGDKNWAFYRKAFGQEKAQPKEAPAAPSGVKVERDLEYARVGKKKLLLDLYLPEKAEGRLPVVIGIHGGAWMAGSKAGGAGRHLAQRGYAVALINYRLSGEAIFPAQIEDCKAAVRWLRANAKKYNLDPDRFGATGHSAGGHLSSLLGTSGDVKEFDKGEHLTFSSRVQAVCAMAGPTDFLQMDANAPAGAKLKHDAPGSPESRLIGGPIQENKEKVAKANPITYVSKDDPPFLIVHGDKDVVVPVHQAQLLNDALKKAGVEVKLHVIKGGGHQFGGREVNDLMAAFFDKHLKKAAAAKEPHGFKLDGSKWTYKDDKVSMGGIFLKPKGEGPFPAILISHGKGGSAAAFGMGKAQEFVKWGVVCIAPNYSHAGGPAAKLEPKGSDGASEENIRRALKCLDILESLPYVDRKRLAAYGHSMGGFVTIGAAGTAPDRLKAAVITGSGIAPKAGFPAPTTEVAGKIRTPFLILHGSLDRVVRPQQSAQLKEILDKNKVANERHVFEGEGHPIDQTRRDDVYKRIKQWLTKQGVLAK